MTTPTDFTTIFTAVLATFASLFILGLFMGSGSSATKIPFRGSNIIPTPAPDPEPALKSRLKRKPRKNRSKSRKRRRQLKTA